METTHDHKPTGSTIQKSRLRKSRFSAKCTQITVSLAVSFLPLTAGIIMGFTGIALPSMTDPDSGDVYLNNHQAPLFTSFSSIGAVFGSIICGPLNIRYGQRVMLLVSMPLAMIGWAMPYISGVFWVLLFSRITLGVVAVISFTCTYSYITETVHCSIRGRLMGLTDLLKHLGTIYLYLVGSTSVNWRTVGVVCGLTPLVIPCIALLHAPNSPRWTAVKGRSKEEVTKSLQYFMDDNYDIEAEYNEIKQDVTRKKECSTTYEQIKLLKEKSIAKRFALLIYLNFLVGFTGIGALNNYYASIFKSTETGINPYMSTILCGCVKLVGSLAYLSIVDRFGRKPTFMASCSIAGLSIAALGLFFHLKHLGYDTSGLFWLPLTAALCSTLVASFYYPVIMVLGGEVLPNSVRSFGMFIISFFLSGGFFVEKLSFPFIADSIGSHWAFYIYATNSLLMIFAVCIFLPETKGKTLEEIAKEFSS